MWCQTVRRPHDSRAASLQLSVRRRRDATFARSAVRQGWTVATAVLLLPSTIEARQVALEAHQNPVVTLPGVTRAGGVEILDDYLAARIESLEQRSPRLRAAMARAREGPILVVIGTPLQVLDRVPHRPWVAPGSGSPQLADFFIHMQEPDSARVGTVVIRTHLDRLQAAARSRTLLGIGAGRAQRWLDETTDAILIHELWGHLIPIVEEGDHTGNCSDPAPGVPDPESCAMKRENAMREELGMKPRTEYPLRIR